MNAGKSKNSTAAKLPIKTLGQLCQQIRELRAKWEDNGSGYESGKASLVNARPEGFEVTTLGRDAGDLIVEAYRSQCLPDCLAIALDSIDPLSGRDVIAVALRVLTRMGHKGLYDCDSKADPYDRLADALESLTRFTSTEVDILRAMLDLHAWDRDSRQTTACISDKAYRKVVDPGNLKGAMAHLSELGITQTVTGRGGGCWLTPTGMRLAGVILKR